MPTAIKLYKECVTWDSIVFLILGLALAFAGYKFWKVISPLFSCRGRNFAVRTHLCSLLHGSMQIACGLMGLVVSYWWIYPILIQHSGLDDGPCWGIAIAIGNVTHASFRTATLIRSSPRACVTGVVLAIGLWYFADPIGIFCMGFMLGVLLGPIRCVARLSRPPAAATCPRGACEYSEYPL